MTDNLPNTSGKLIGSPIPLEQIALPAALDGHNGANRAPASAVKQIAANTDLEAIAIWLSEFKDSPNTTRGYRKEVERLVLWSVLERGKSLSSLTREDFQIFESFLANPEPRVRWCGPRKPRISPDWRPFLGPLKPSSLHLSLVTINALFTYLVAAGYLAGNPLALMRRRGRKKRNQEPDTVERFLEQETWQALMDYVETLPTETQRQRAYHERIRYLLALLYLAGPRVSEVANHTMGDFIEVRGKWWWKITGKGNKSTRIPVNRTLLDALTRYRLFLGHSALPSIDETTPLVLSINGKRGISANMVYRIIKDILARAANALMDSEPQKAEKLRRASTHWFRHTAITHQADAGIELRYLNKSARHAKLETTAVYLHAEEDKWHTAMEKHRITPTSKT